MATTRMPSTTDPKQFEPPIDGHDMDGVTCVCIGSGRFLRAVLVPAVHSVGGQTIIAQPRGTSFSNMMRRRLQQKQTSNVKCSGYTYEVDTVGFDGQVATETIPVAGVGSLGSEEGLSAFTALPARLPGLRIIGVGVTEAGIYLGSPSMAALYGFLRACHACLVKGDEKSQGYGGECGRGGYMGQKVSVINTDNVPANGDTIASIVRDLAEADFADANVDENEDETCKKEIGFLKWLNTCVCFHNTM